MINIYKETPKSKKTKIQPTKGSYKCQMITKSNFASKNASKTSIQSYFFMEKVFKTDICLLIFKLIILLDCVSYRKNSFLNFPVMLMPQTTS